LTAAVRAKPIPVFPEVGSINVSPGLILPDFSAFSIILRPILSFTDPPAFKNSHFAYKLQFSSLPTELSFTVGVCPIAPKILSKGICLLSLKHFEGVSTTLI